MKAVPGISSQRCYVICFALFWVHTAHCYYTKLWKMFHVFPHIDVMLMTLPPFFLTLPALFGEHNAGEQWSGILMANYKMPFLWKKYQRNPSEICSKFREIENILLWSIFSWVEFETHRSWLWMKIYSEKSIKEPKRSRPNMLNGREVLTQVSEKKFTFDAQMRISDCLFKSETYLITQDRVSEVHCHVSQRF